RSSRPSSRRTCVSRRALPTRNRSSASRPTAAGRLTITDYPRRSSAVSKLRGLPSEIRMRHDVHFVEELSAPRATEPVGRMVDLNLIDVNPHQPRKSMGDLADLICSIKEKGVLEPVLVREVNGRYQIIAGERRY